MKKLKNSILSIVMSFMLVFASFSMAGCSASQFETVLNEVGPAVSTILQIIAIVKGGTANTSVVAKIDSDVAGLEKLYTDLDKSVAANKASVEAELNASFVVLNSDLSTVFAVAQVSDKNTQAKITALIGLVESAVRIAEAAVPRSTPVASASKPLTLDATSLRDSFNKILVAKTGNAAVDAFTVKHQIHNHSKVVRVLSLGAAK